MIIRITYRTRQKERVRMLFGGPMWKKFVRFFETQIPCHYGWIRESVEKCDDEWMDNLPFCSERHVQYELDREPNYVDTDMDKPRNYDQFIFSHM